MEFMVAHVVPYFPTLTERAILNELLFLQRQGVAQIICGFRPPPEESRLAGPDVDLLLPHAVYLDPAPRRSAWARAARGALPAARGRLLHPGTAWRRWRDFGLWRPADVTRADRLRELVATHGPRLLHVHFAHVAPLGLAVARAANVPLVVSCRGLDLALLSRRPRRVCEQLFAAKDVRFLTRSRAMSEQLLLMGCPGKRINVHRSAVNLEELPFRLPERHAGEARVLMVGRLVPKKGFDAGLRAAAASRRRPRVTVIGAGPERDALRALARTLNINDRVDWLGAVDHERVVREMRRADVLLQPSRRTADGDREGIPNALIEAMALGLPVVATRHPGIDELVAPHVSGLLAGEDDADGLAAALDALLDDPEAAHRMVVAARDAVEAHHDARRQARVLARFYQALIDHERPGR